MLPAASDTAFPSQFIELSLFVLCSPAKDSDAWQEQWTDFALIQPFAVQVGVAYPETSVPGSLQNRSSGHSAFLFWYCMRLVILRQLKGMFEQCGDSFFSFFFLFFVLFCTVCLTRERKSLFHPHYFFFYFFLLFRYRMMSWRKKNRFLLVCLMSADSEQVAPGVLL